MKNYGKEIEEDEYVIGCTVGYQDGFWTRAAAIIGLIGMGKAIRNRYNDWLIPTWMCAATDCIRPGYVDHANPGDGKPYCDKHAPPCSGR